MRKPKHNYWFTILKYLLLSLLACIFFITISSKPDSDEPNNQSASLITNVYSNTDLRQDFHNWQQTGNLEFIENRGQIVDTEGNPRPDIAYVADGNGVKLYFTATGVSYVFTKIEKSESKNVLKFDSGFGRFNRDELEESKVTTYRMDMKLLNSNPNVKIYAAEEAEGYFNYYYAHCPDGILGVKAYKRLIYENIYDDIDLVFYDNEKGMEYDFVVKPGGKVQNIRFQYEGAEQVSLLENGKLKVINRLGQIIEEAPKTYTMRNHQGMIAKRIHDTIVKSFYRLQRNIISFKVSDFDTNQTLIIDPELSWATYYGGSFNDISLGVAIDGNRDVVITGWTDSPDFPVDSGAVQTGFAGDSDAFIVKFSSSGSRQWATYYGGAELEYGWGIITDGNGNVVITGWTESSDFPVTSGAFQPNRAGSLDAFIVKFSSSGSRQWATYYGGDYNDFGSGIAIDGNGNVVITGWTESIDFPVTSDAFQPNRAGVFDAFIVKFSSSGSRQWATYYGGAYTDYGWGIASDGNENVMITGYTESTDFPVTSGAFQPNRAGSLDAFIVKFSSDGSRQWATYYGGADLDYGWDIANDRNGNVVITGYTDSPDFPVDSGAVQTGFAGDSDAFIVKFSSSGDRQWATYYGGNEIDEGRDVAIDGHGNVVITGCTDSPDFPVTSGTFQTGYAGIRDAFIAKLSSSGNRQWATYYGGNENDEGWDVAIDGNGNVAIAGLTTSADFPVTSGAFQTGYANGSDAFIVKFSVNPLSAPMLSSPSSGTADVSTNPRLSWNAVNDALFYRLQVSVYSDFTITAFDESGIPTTSKTVPDLSSNARYYWRVNATGEYLTTDWSDVWNFTTILLAPEPPALVLPSDNSIGVSSSPTLIWQASNGAESYRLQVSTSSDFSTVIFDESGITETFKKITKLDNDKTYYWRVLASNLKGPSNWSTVWHFTTVPIINLNNTISFPQYDKASDYKATDYQIVGLPGASDLPVETLFSGNSGTDWQAYWDNGLPTDDPKEYLIGFDNTSTFNFSAGCAFWLIKKGNLRIIKDVEALSLTDSRYAAIPLHLGWNLITNPFLTPLNWSEVEALNDSINPIWKYNGVKNFSDTTVFDPYIGYYFYADSSLDTLKIPYPQGLEKSIVSTDNSEPESWKVHISLSSGHFIDKTLSFGVSGLAKTGLDKLDFRKPRGIASVPNVSFHRPEWDLNYSIFATDNRPEFDEIESWDFEVRGVHQQNARLEFKGIEQIPEQMEIYLVDEGRGKYINLREQSNYSFMGIGNIMKFWVVVGKSEAVKEKLNEINIPKKFALGNNYPNPFNPSTTIPIEIPVASDVTLKIYNILGQEVKIVYEGHIEIGQYQFSWDGRDETGNRLASGVYILQLSTNTRISLTSKMILMQ